MARKKIVIVTRNMNSGGAERVIAQLANYFSKKYIDCIIVTVDEVQLSYELNSNIRIISIGKKWKSKLTQKVYQYSNVRKIVKAEKPDVVLSMPEEIGIYVILALVGTKIPVFVSERNNPWAMPNVKITRILRKLMYPLATGLIFQTEMAKSFFPKVVQKKGVVIGNPVDADRIPLPFEGERKKIIVGAGRLEKQKNFSLLIAAFSEFVKKFPDYELYIYGEGKLQNQLEREAKQLEIADKVHMPGRDDNLLLTMNDSAMFVLSSDYEGMPNVLIEAMCMGMPVISTDCPSGGPKELIINQNNGLLIPVGDQEALVKAMIECCDKKIAQELSHNAYRIKDKLVGDTIFEKWYDFMLKK